MTELRNDKGMTCWQALATARRMVEKVAPYLQSGIQRLAPVEAPGLGTMAVTESMILMVDPAYVVKQSIEALCADLIHELSHILRDSHGRTRKLCCTTPETMRLSNIAADIPIGDDLEAMGLPVSKAPVPGITSASFKFPSGRTHEEYFFMLCKKLEEEKAQSSQSSQSSQSGQGQEGSGDDSQGDGQGNDGAGDGDSGEEESDQGSGNGPVSLLGHKPGCGRGRCGSGGGNPVPGEPKQDEVDADGNPVNQDGTQANNGNDGFPGRTRAEIEQTRQEVAEAISNHVKQKGQGSMPGGWAQWASEFISPPKVPWQQKLARAARNAIRYRCGAVDLRFDGVSRRQGGLGYGIGTAVMPRFRAPVPEVEVVVDTSGSMGASDFDKAMPEIHGVLRAVGSDVSYVAIDAAIHVDERVKSWKDVRSKLIGGGGTVFSEYFDRLDKMRKGKRPSLVVFVTDGMACGVPSKAPKDVSFIWLLTGTGYKAPCTWGESINLD